MSNVVPFPLAKRRGYIDIWPCTLDDGCWAVDHVSASGSSAALIGYFFSLDEAIAAARQAAKRLDAEFDEQPANGGAA